MGIWLDEIKLYMTEQYPFQASVLCDICDIYMYVLSFEALAERKVQNVSH